MKKEKNFYLAPELYVVTLRAPSIICQSGNTGNINPSEEEDDDKDWGNVY